MRFSVPAALAAITLAVAVPVQARAETRSLVDPATQGMGEGAEGLGGLMSIFTPEPLTEEQQARLPKATAVIEKMIPPGTMGEVMGSMFDRMLGPIANLASIPSKSLVADALGTETLPGELDEAQAEEALALLDPAWKDRRDHAMSAVQTMTGRMMTVMEPVMKKAMAEAYAANFDDRELADIDAFFSTESGVAFARKSYAMSSDPRILGATMTAMPAMMASLSGLEDEMKAAMAEIPPPRSYADLDAGQRERLAELTGLDQSEIEQGIARAAKQAEEADESEWDEPGDTSEPSETL